MPVNASLPDGFLLPKGTGMTSAQLRTMSDFLHNNRVFTTGSVLSLTGHLTSVRMFTTAAGRARLCCWRRGVLSAGVAGQNSFLPEGVRTI